jgi:hypothetical protein
VSLSRRRAIQCSFSGLTITFLSLALQHYPIYRNIVDFRVAYDLERFVEAGWLIYLGGFLALYGG